MPFASLFATATGLQIGVKAVHLDEQGFHTPLAFTADRTVVPITLLGLSNIEQDAPDSFMAEYLGTIQLFEPPLRIAI